jgi:hypothetical protein
MTPATFTPAAAGLRAYAILGDHMQPRLRTGDYLLVTPAKAYDGEGTYILDFGGDGAGCPYIAERVPVRGMDEVRIWHPNPAYSCHVIGMDQFARAVRGKAVAEVRMMAPLEEVARSIAA